MGKMAQEEIFWIISSKRLFLVRKVGTLWGCCLCLPSFTFSFRRLHSREESVKLPLSCNCILLFWRHHWIFIQTFSGISEFSFDQSISSEYAVIHLGDWWFSFAVSCRISQSIPPMAIYPQSQWDFFGSNQAHARPHIDFTVDSRSKSTPSFYCLTSSFADFTS